MFSHPPPNLLRPNMKSISILKGAVVLYTVKLVSLPLECTGRRLNTTSRVSLFLYGFVSIRTGNMVQK
jgi:hypothetical protein